ncbi:UNVERIFIED_CONTAM: hypothetical protein GTU68_056111 [Idotea baltica]|nr:hypothetical protein [Idotea baltica]
MASIGSKIGCAPQLLNTWVKKLEVDTGQISDITTKQAEQMKTSEREVHELKQTNEILRKASACLLPHSCRDAGRNSTAH